MEIIPNIELIKKSKCVNFQPKIPEYFKNSQSEINYTKKCFGASK
jgi:hypothetical protein